MNQVCKEVLLDDYISIYLIQLQLIKTNVEKSILVSFESKTIKCFPPSHRCIYEFYKSRITSYKPNEHEIADSSHDIYTQWYFLGIANGK